MIIRTGKILLLCLGSGLLFACFAGPNYEKPPVEMPKEFKENKGWKSATPFDRESKGKWWEAFQDPYLSELIAQAELSNQNLVQAEAQYLSARALVDSARAGLFPTLTANASSTRSKASQNTAGISTGPANLHAVSLDASWEPDFWGRVGRAVESNAALEQASFGDMETLKLSVDATLAQDYFMLRILDKQKELLDETAAGYEKSLDLTKNRYQAGVAGKVDVVQAEAQLKTTQAQAVDLAVQRSQLEHAIAVLIGRPPSLFSIPAEAFAARIPEVPAGIPSDLLERRPDIAAAERRVAAANAQIGVAKSAFFPALTLTAGGGYQSSALSTLFTAPNTFWSLGGAIAEELFDGGVRRALVHQSEAAYEASVAAYRQTVLGAFQDVEDNLASLRILEKEAEIQKDAVQASQMTVELYKNQYKAGTVSYLDVVTVQATELANERTEITLLGERITASVLLIKAIGGSWRAD
jgi:NodT family efflux transporter outer membrane factor (OMF) lipoprotein